MEEIKDEVERVMRRSRVWPESVVSREVNMLSKIKSVEKL